MEAFAKITSKGQVTIPKKIREFLKTDVIAFKLEEGKVIIEPVKDLGGIFKKYAKKRISFEEERDKAWEKVATRLSLSRQDKDCA